MWPLQSVTFLIRAHFRHCWALTNICTWSLCPGPSTQTLTHPQFVHNCFGERFGFVWPEYLPRCLASSLMHNQCLIRGSFRLISQLFWLAGGWRGVSERVPSPDGSQGQLVACKCIPRNGKPTGETTTTWPAINYGIKKLRCRMGFTSASKWCDGWELRLKCISFIHILINIVIMTSESIISQISTSLAR